VLNKDVVLAYQPSMMIICPSGSPIRLRFLGSDYSVAHRLGGRCRKVVQEVSSLTMEIGAIISRLGYRGIFNIDYLVPTDNPPMFMELNPRYGASLHLLSRAASRHGRLELSPHSLHIHSFLSGDQSRILTYSSLNGLIDSVITLTQPGDWSAWYYGQPIREGDEYRPTYCVNSKAENTKGYTLSASPLIAEFALRSTSRPLDGFAAD
jgi:hypothetical protein